jgi:hypothetical protein
MITLGPVRRAGLVIPQANGAGLRFLRAALGLRDTRVGLVSQDPLDSFPPDVRASVAGHWTVRNALDPQDLAAAARGVAGQLGGLDRFFGVQEHLQLPVAQARAGLGIPGMDVETCRGFRDKALMKSRLRAAGVPCARHRLAANAAEARAAAREVGYPLIVKPPAGAGAADTHRVEEPAQLDAALKGYPVLLEEFVRGEEHSFDSVWLGGEALWHSVSVYRPSCLEVLRNAWIQWTVLLPRRIDGAEYDPVRAAGEAALRALGFANGMSHMEWFRRLDGTVAISEVGARPPGAQFTTLLGLAHDADLYAAWTRLMIHGEFDPPARRCAAGGAYLRAMGKGRVARVRGAEEVSRALGPLIAEAKWPEPGQEAGEGYEGQGYVLLRHEDTAVVERGLLRIVETVRVDLV